MSSPSSASRPRLRRTAGRSFAGSTAPPLREINPRSAGIAIAAAARRLDLQYIAGCDIDGVAAGQLRHGAVGVHHPVASERPRCAAGHAVGRDGPVPGQHADGHRLAELDAAPPPAPAPPPPRPAPPVPDREPDRKTTRPNPGHLPTSSPVFSLKKKKNREHKQNR